LRRTSSVLFTPTWSLKAGNLLRVLKASIF